MKRIFNIPNLLMLVQILLSAAITVIFVFYKPFEAYHIILMQISAVVGIILVRFAKPISEIQAKLYEIFYNVQTVDTPEEKLSVALFVTKFGGYIFILIQLVFLFV
ncbi:MAG: hypothetical protein K2O39_05565 [Clostridiales bacterium]|nr:hypothetical protein [Clostridiales bacterium]